MDQQIKIYPRGGIILSNKQEKTAATHDIVDEFQAHMLSERSEISEILYCLVTLTLYSRRCTTRVTKSRSVASWSPRAGGK